MGVLLFFVSPTYFRPLLQNALGLVLGLLAILLLAIGNFLMYRIGEVDV
jgi:Flp pilus assembly protein TadB